MKQFECLVVIECENAEEAWQVLGERTGYDEDYGFEYRILEANVVKERE